MEQNKKMDNDLMKSAIEYAKIGFAVFPVMPKTKCPATTHGFKDATTDIVQVQKWWTENPNYNIGVATGKRSNGLLVVDLDIDEEKGKNGYDELKQWQQEHGELPDTWTSITGRGGYHLLFRTDKDTACSTNVLNGVDVRGDGGYIIVPPSIHQNGNYYEWEQFLGDCELAEANDLVFQFITPNRANQNNIERFGLDEKIQKGERVTTLFKLVCSLVSKGLSDSTIKNAIQEENQKKCVPPLTLEELEKEVFPALKRYEKGEIKSSSSNPKEAFNLDLVSMDDIEEKEPEWLISNYIPKYQITTLAGDGGAGKTTIWCNIAAAVSSGKRSFLEESIPEEFARTEPKTVLFFSSEDSFEYTLKKRLKSSGAILKNIHSISLKDERFSKVKFNSPFLEQLIAHYKPQLVIFDPIQSYLPADIQMGQRNAMRACLNPLIGLGEKYGTTFLIIVHANKQTGVYGRKRIADSADIWDISRSVLMVGDTSEKGIRYISHEKSNYGMTGDSVLFSIKNGQIENKGYSDKKDREFVSENSVMNYQQPQRDEAKELILEFLKDGEKEVTELDEMAKAMSIGSGTLKRAKTDLKKEQKIVMKSRGFNPKKWYVSLTDCK